MLSDLKPLPPVSTLNFNDESLFCLVKVPSYLADAWFHAERGTELGTASLIHKAGVSDPLVEMTAKPLKGMPANVPLEFSCNYSKQLSNEIKIFSEDVKGHLAMEGLVNIKVDCVAKDSALLGKSINDRALEIKKSEFHDLKVFEEKGLDTYLTNQAVFSNTLTAKNQKPKKKGEKRERMEETALQELIFAAFYHKPLLTLAELDKQLDQPVQYLKEVLSKICIYHTSGKHRLHYEVKDEYKSKKMRLESAAALEKPVEKTKPKVEVKLKGNEENFDENFED